jgi:hypothetical protein
MREEGMMSISFPFLFFFFFFFYFFFVFFFFFFSFFFVRILLPSFLLTEQTKSFSGKPALYRYYPDW